MVIARYKADWQYLSDKHKEIDDKKIQRILSEYAENQLEHLAYAIIGTFGSGKTQFLYHIFKCVKNGGMLPLYFLAEDLFREVIKPKEIFGEDKTFTPGDLYNLVEGKINHLKESFSKNDESKVREVIDPRGKLKNDAPQLVDVVIEEFSSANIEDLKVVLLVDELEGQYGVLQDKVQTRDRSPLREWLESQSHLKFLAFAPAGIYELGGADRDRVKRIVMPPADIDYVRRHLIENPGRSNACWWLSRGKARHLFKACETLKEKNIQLEADEVSRIIKDELDPIGQEPTQVPPAVTSAINPSKLPFLLNIAPIKEEKTRQYEINTNKLETGKLADKLVDAFGVNKDNAILISEYFKRTIKTLSNEDGVTYIRDTDLPELFCLVFDHLLEYEHGSPELTGTLGEVLNLYERVKREDAAVYGIIGRLWELKESEWQLPLTIEQIRKAFPFPTMNPIVKNHVPADMRGKWEGRGLPLWKWAEGDITALLFASKRDFTSYSEKDEFLSLALPDGKGVLCLFPTGERLKEEHPFLVWLTKNSKFEFVELPPLLTDFLLSATGEIQGGIPGDLQVSLENFKEDKEDILLSRKAAIYGEAIDEIVRNSAPKPDEFEKGVLPDAAAIWGKTQLADRGIAVSGIALAFADLTYEERQLLANIMELFKGGKEGKGIGDLRPLLPRGGYPTLADDLLPRYGRKDELKDSDSVSRLKGYWRDEEKEELVNLARILRRDSFLKLHADEDMNRLLEALWRVTRREFDFGDFDNCVQKIERDILPTLKDCWELEREGINSFGLKGLNFENNENLVKAKQGFEKLLEIVRGVLSDRGTASPLLKCIMKTFIDSLDVENDLRKLASLSSSTKRALEELTKSGENLGKNFWEYRRATKFLGIAEDDIKGLVLEQMGMDGTPTLQELESDAKERKEYLEKVSNSLGLLDKKLAELGNTFDRIKGKG